MFLHIDNQIANNISVLRIIVVSLIGIIVFISLLFIPISFYNKLYFNLNEREFYYYVLLFNKIRLYDSRLNKNNAVKPSFKTIRKAIKSVALDKFSTIKEVGSSNIILSGLCAYEVVINCFVDYYKNKNDKMKAINYTIFTDNENGLIVYIESKATIKLLNLFNIFISYLEDMLNAKKIKRKT